MKKRSLTDPLRSPLSIYEIQSKSWKSGVDNPMNYREMAPELANYCDKMGFTHVEMFSLLEHGYRGERGYRIANYFAPYRDNGMCDDLKYLVDYLHKNDNLHASDASQWATLYFDFSKEETRRLLFGSALYFLDEIHIDGIRFDAVSQMIRRHSKDIIPAISFLRQLNQTIHRCYPGVLCIAEETEGYPSLNKNMDFDLKWNIGWSHDTRNLLRTPYKERPNHWQHKVLNVLNHVVFSDDKMILTSSHDDSDSLVNSNDRVLLSCVAHSRNDEERFADLRNFFGWQTLAPSRGHMIHMGEEFVQPLSWYQRFCRGLSSTDWALADPSSWHGKMQQYVADLNKFYIHHPQFWQNGEQDFMMIYEYGPNLVVAYHRGVYVNRRMAIIHNFSNRGYHSYSIPLPGSDPLIARIQNIVEIFNSDNTIYGGSGKFQNEKIEMVNDRGNGRLFKLVIPPLATIVLEEHLN
jgi:1,4-alpha-glucan branching enzyme